MPFILLSLLLTTHPSEVLGGLACLSNPCLHGVCLDDLNSTYFCYCIDGYTGILCQKNWNDCWSDPCQNGGICIDGVASFNCSCPPGFTGDLCEVDFNECESNPCQNNGTCQDAANGYVCNCHPGYSGNHCEIDVAVCNATNTTRCDNGGICQEGPGETFTCACQPGWGNPFCDVEIDECMSMPCRNGAVCIDLMADYSCACLFGFTGRNCEELVKICEENPCSNGALCLVEDRRPVCYCVPDFHGELCQFQYDECQIGPKCMNGGTCIDGIDNSTCSCPPGLTGRRCECLILDDNQLDCTYISPETTFIPSTVTTTTEVQVPNFTTTITEPFPATTIATTEFMTTTTSTTEAETETTTAEETSTVQTTTERDQRTIFSTTASWSSDYSTTTPKTESSSPSSTSTESTAETETFPPQSSAKSSTVEEVSLPSSISTFLTEQPEATTTEMSDGTTSLTSIPPIDCSRNPCENGGTCIFLDSQTGYQCSCPFDTEGSFCEHKLGIRRAAFIGDSYLKHVLTSFKNVSIEFEAKTLADGGLLFYADLDNSYMVLYLEDGKLKFKFSCGYQTMLLSELKIPVNTGNLMKVKTRLEFNTDLKRCDASIAINDSLSMTGDQTALLTPKFSKPSYWLYLGGIPQEISAPNLPDSGFIGCISNLKLFGRKLDIFQDAEDGFGVTECSSLACLSNPCHNGGTCHTKLEQWTCSCKNGFLGTMCEKSVCENNPCLYGGTCIPFSGSGYICLCPFGKHGHFCENDLKVTQPYFSSTIRGWSSYVAYPIPARIADSMEIKFKFAPTATDQISILLFIGQKGQHDFYSDHMSVSFVKGYIMLTWNLGSGPRRIFTNQPIESNKTEYSVRIGRIGRRAWLQVDNQDNITGRSPGNLIKLDVSPMLFLGGHDSRNFSILPHDLPMHTGFSGCIFDVEIVSGSLIIPLQGSRLAIGRSVGQCGTSECYDSVCQNGGICLHHTSTFMCLCQDGWFGPVCSFRHNPCDSANHKCLNGATCVPMIGDYECDCPIGQSGEFCETNDEYITDVNLTGLRSFVAVDSSEIFQDFQKLNIEFELRPLSDNGLIIFAQKSENSFILISLQKGVLEFKISSAKNKIFNFMNDFVSISSSKILIKGLWFKVQAGIFGKKAYISVDNVINTAVLPTEGLNLYQQTIYIGGLPDLSHLPHCTISHQLPTPFHGCIRHLFLNNQQKPLTKENLISGRNIGDCDGTPCGKDACQNGGTCWLDSFLKPHCTCTPPFYGIKCENMSACDDSWCRHGTCEGSRCSCIVGYDGAFCENRIIVKNPEFSGKSFLIVKTTGDRRRNIKIGQTDNKIEVRSLFLNFTSVKSEGLLLWSKAPAGSLNNYIGVGLDKGFLKVIHATNQSFTVNYSYYKVSDGLWHSVEVSFGPFSVKLDQSKIQFSKKTKQQIKSYDVGDNSLFTDGLFYIGGVPDGGNSSVFKLTNGSFVGSFEGCIEGFATNGEKVIRDFTDFQGRDVGVCRIF